MPSLPRNSRSRPVRSSSIRSRQPSYRDAAQQTSESRTSSRRRPASQQHRRPNRSPSPSPARQSATHPDRKRFGLHVHDNQPRIGKFDFEERYPEDPIYEELGPNARAWRVNLDESEVYDNDMVVEARDGLDLLLVFAGLFSAVLTTFVAQTSQSLSNNFPAVSTSLLLEIVTLQRAFINGTPVDDISSSEMTWGPSGFDVWVNALWFTSLTLSLGTALMAVLVKQWLYQYMSFASGTARDRSLIRFYRFDGLRKWHVLTIIGSLPIVLHIALGLFLAGLVIFLIPLNVPLASIVGLITVVIYAMYTVSNILPIIFTQCPYRTPFSDILNVLMRPIFTMLSSISSSALARAIRTLFVSAVASAVRIYRLLATPISHLFGPSKETFEFSYPYVSPKVAFPTLKEAERLAATGDEVAQGIACDALLWLYQMTSNPPTKSIVLQSLGCLSDDVSDRLVVVNTDLEKALEEVIHENRLLLWSILPGQESCAERLLRAQRHIKAAQLERGWWEAGGENFKPPFHILASILSYAPAMFVKPLGSYRHWSSYDLFMQIIQEYSAGHPILLPSALWQQFMNVILSRQLHLENTESNLRLCHLALQSWDNNERTPSPFSAGVLITHDTVPLKRILTDKLPQNDLPDSEPLRQLCTINDYIVSELSGNRNLVTDDTISVLLQIWNRIPRPDNSTSGDLQAISRRAEKCILEVFAGDWWDRRSDANVYDQCYDSVVETYSWYSRDNVPHPEVFAKLFSELCWSPMFAKISGAIARIFDNAFGLDIDTPMVYHTLLLGSESPLFSPQTKLTLARSTIVSRAMSGFVNKLARGSHSQAFTHQCMELLCAEPDRLFTVCRVLALGRFQDNKKEDVAKIIGKLVRLYPSRAAWQERTHYLNVKPWDWPHFLMSEDDRYTVRVQERMQFALQVLDDFFASLENPPNVPAVSPSCEPGYRSAVTQASVDSQPGLDPPNVVSRWRRVRQLVSSTRAFHHRLSSPANTKLPGPSDDRSYQTSTSESRHTLATIEPANATAGPSGDDRMV